MASIKTNLEILAKLGVTKEGSTVEGILPLKGDEKAADIEKIVKAAQEAVAKAEAAKGGDQGGANSSSNQNNADVAAASTVLVWVKGRTYISDTQRIDGALYRLTLPLPARLLKSSRDVVEVFTDAISPRKLSEIAKWSGLAHPEDYTDEQILDKIVVAELKPF